jgi:UPF0271 protein
MTPQDNLNSRCVIVLDTSAFVAGFDPFVFPAELVTPPKAEEEIRRNSMVKTRLEAAIENGKLTVRVPSAEFMEQALALAGKSGDKMKLSQTDLQVLALALELKAGGFAPQIVTDDYAIQNVARQMGVEFVALATLGIKRVLDWVRYCPACHREYPAQGKTKECQVCGTELKRKPRRQKPPA